MPSIDLRCRRYGCAGQGGNLDIGRGAALDNFDTKPAILSSRGSYPSRKMAGFRSQKAEEVHVWLIRDVIGRCCGCSEASQRSNFCYTTGYSRPYGAEMFTTPSSSRTCDTTDLPTVTMAQALLSGFVMIFSAWMIRSGYTPLTALVIASGAVVAGTGFLVIPRTLIRLARALGKLSC